VHKLHSIKAQVAMQSQAAAHDAVSINGGRIGVLQQPVVSIIAVRRAGVRPTSHATCITHRSSSIEQAKLVT